ncbi:MAG: hypothetical protein OEY14_15260, partial [Myxococcales bacterium]|nr:hypothetical protein [Myxococcales bacterium]
MQESFFSRQFWLLAGVFFFAMACSGGGCSTCASCGIEPIPGGYPIAERIDNSMQVRLTSSGIQFMEDNAAGLVDRFLPGGLNFEIPPTSTTTSVAVLGDVDIDVCAGGGCFVQGEVRSLDLVPTAPNRLQVRLRLLLQTVNAAGAPSNIPIAMVGGCTFLGCVVDTTCQASLDTSRGSRPEVGIVANVDFNEEGHIERIGYTRVDVSGASIDPAADLEDADIEFGGCSGISGALINFVAGFLQGQIVDQLRSQVNDTLQSAVADQLCMSEPPSGCPTGTTVDGSGICNYSDGTCVPQLLGTDGRGDLGVQAVGGFSPGAHAPSEFLLAAGGEGVANDGLSLFFYGGFLSMNRDFSSYPGHNPCVPLIDPPALPIIPQAPTFLSANQIAALGAPHDVAIGVSEMYMNHAGYGIFDSGLLCVGTGTRASQQLSTGLLSALIRSLDSVAFPEDASAIGLMLRPQLAPIVEVGGGADSGEDLLTITLPELQIDFYVWSTERYVRFMTFQSDMQIGVNLVADAGQIVPEVSGISALNPVVTNSELLTEDPAALAGLVENVINMFAGMATGGLSGFDLPDVMGLRLVVPPGGIRGIDESGDEFLGIFANFELAPAMAYTAAADTRMEIGEIRIDPVPLALETFGQGPMPQVQLTLEGIGPEGAELEYSYRFDEGQWSRWTRDPNIVAESPYLFLQGRHPVEARARVIDAPRTVDPEPARGEIIIDVLAPEIRMQQIDADRFLLEARDIVSNESLEYRVRFDDAAFGEWLPLLEGVELDGSAARIVQVEVRDESGNVGARRENLIRGLPNPSASGSGCGCAVPGRSGDDGAP